MNIHNQDQFAMEVALAEIHQTLRQATARGVSRYVAKGPEGHKIEVFFFKPGFFARDNHVRHKVVLTKYIQAYDGEFRPHPSEYEFLSNNPVVRHVARNSHKEIVYDGNATLEDIMDLNSYLRTWTEMPAHYR